MADGFYERQLNNENHFIAGGLSGIVDNSMDRLTNTLQETMRGFSDQLHFQLQSLNLTLNTLNSGIYDLGSKIGNLGINNAGQYIPSGIHPGTFLGMLGRDFANYQGRFLGVNSLLTGNSNFINRPYNISGMEFYTATRMHRDLILPKFGANLISGLVDAILPFPLGFLSNIGSDGFFTGTHAYMDNADMIRRMSGRFRSGQMQMPEAYRVSKGIQRLSYNELLNTSGMDTRLGFSGFTDIAGLGLQGDLFHGKSPDELVKQIKEAGKVVKTLSGILGSKDVKEAMDALVQLKNMGVNVAKSGGIDYVRGLASNSFGYGIINGMTAGQTLNSGLQIAQSGFGSNNIPSALGVRQGIQNLAYISELEKRGILTAADIAKGGGHMSMAAKSLSLDAQLLKSGMGNAWFAAGFKDGVFDPRMSSNAMEGNFTNVIGSAFGNMLGGKGLFTNYANIATNMDNYLLAGQNIDPDFLNKRRRQEFNHIVHQIGFSMTGSRKDKENMLALFLIKNKGMSPEEAKAEAYRYFNPVLDRQIELQNRNAVLKSDLNAANVYTSAGGFWQRTVNDRFSRLWANIQQPFVRAGEYITEEFTRNPLYYDKGINLQAGESIFYDDEVDKNNKKTGLRKFNSKKFADLFAKLDKENTSIDKEVFQTYGGQLGIDIALATMNNESAILKSALPSRNSEITKSILIQRMKNKFFDDYTFLGKGNGLLGQHDIQKSIQDTFENIFGKPKNNSSWNEISTSKFIDLAEKNKGGDLDRWAFSVLEESIKNNKNFIDKNKLKYSNISQSKKDSIEKSLKTYGPKLDNIETNISTGNVDRNGIKNDISGLISIIATETGLTHLDVISYLKQSGRYDKLLSDGLGNNYISAIQLSGTKEGQNAIKSIKRSKDYAKELNFQNLIADSSGAGIDDINNAYDIDSRWNQSFFESRNLLTSEGLQILELLNSEDFQENFFNAKINTEYDESGNFIGFSGKNKPMKANERLIRIEEKLAAELYGKGHTKLQGKEKEIFETMMPDLPSMASPVVLKALRRTLAKIADSQLDLALTAKGKDTFYSNRKAYLKNNKGKNLEAYNAGIAGVIYTGPDQIKNLKEYDSVTYKEALDIHKKLQSAFGTDKDFDFNQFYSDPNYRKQKGTLAENLFNELNAVVTKTGNVTSEMVGITTKSLETSQNKASVTYNSKIDLAVDNYGDKYVVYTFSMGDVHQGDTVLTNERAKQKDAEKIQFLKMQQEALTESKNQISGREYFYPRKS